MNESGAQKVLDLAGSQLTSLPESIERLATLEELDLDRNQLGSLPDWFEGLSNLRSLIQQSDFFLARKDRAAKEIARNAFDEQSAGKSA